MNKWDSRFMSLANEIAKWSSCLHRQVGCVIVRDKRILTTGYNGAPSGIESCKEKAICLRDTLSIRSGENLELCHAVHAEQNAIAQAAKLGLSLENATLYCTHYPCSVCSKLIINSGIKHIVYEKDYPHDLSYKYFEAVGIDVQHYEGENHD